MMSALDDLPDRKRLAETAARLRTLERLNRLVSSSLDFEDVLSAIARAASDVMQAPVVSFWLADEDAGTVTVRAFSDPKLRDDFPLTTSRFGEGMVGKVAAQRAAIHVPDVFAPDSPILARDWFVRHGLSSFYGVPVFFQDHILAVIALNGRAPFALDGDDHDLLESFVAQAAVAIRNARLFEDAERGRRAAEAAEARYQTLFDRNLAGLLRTTAGGRIVDCNDALVRMLGYASRAELLAKPVADFYVDPAERSVVLAGLERGHRLMNLELHWRRADGSPLTVLANVAVFREGRDEAVMDGIIVDISDRKRLAAVEQEAATLRAVARLANAAAHEINNPLAVILLQVGVLASELAGDSKATARLERATAACERIKEMVASMSHITRLEVFDTSPNLPSMLDLRRSSDASDPPAPR